MRHTVYFVHATLNGRTSAADGSFWEPFPWGGEEEMAWNNQLFRSADTWLLGRVMYESIVPWWDTVATGGVPDDLPDLTAEDREFARLQHGLRKVVVSHKLEIVAAERTELSRDPVGDLWKLKQSEGRSVLVSCGPALFAQLMAEPGLINELLIVVHPVALDNGPELFGHLQRTVPLELLSATHFSQGALVVRYATRWS